MAKKKSAKKSAAKSKKKAARKGKKAGKRVAGKSKPKAKLKAKARSKAKAKPSGKVKKSAGRTARKVAGAKRASSAAPASRLTAVNEGAEVSELMMWAGVQDVAKPAEINRPGIGDDDDGAAGIGAEKPEGDEDFGDVDDDEL